MRRNDREVTAPEEITAIMGRCEVLRLALNTETVPYILPVNFGMEPDGMTLYFHGAMEGTKYDWIARDSRASFEMDCPQGLVLDEAKRMCTMNYESVIGWGQLTEITGEAEKMHALRRIMAQYRSEDFEFGTAALPRTRVFRLDVRERTAKRRIKTPGGKIC